MLAKSCQCWLIWYLLFFCHGGAEGQLQWVVKEKVTAYGQNLTLFCPVENCCSEPAGWFVGDKTIIIDVKAFSNDPSVKYHGTYNTDGFGVVIRNLSEADLNVTYHSVYGFNQSTPKYLLHGDVFKENVPDKDKEIDTTAAIVVPIVVAMVVIGLIIGICVYRSRKKRQKQTGTDEEMKNLNPSDSQMKNQQDPQEMHAMLGRIIVTVLPKMCQQILESIIPAENLYCSYQNRHDLKMILVEEEPAIIHKMMSDGYKHFTVQLCYKILRHEECVGTPRLNWGNVPLHTDIHISDDIERIRLSRNKIVSMETKSLDKTTFLTLIDEFREIAKRVDLYLKKGGMFLLQIQPTESMTKAEIESAVEEIHRLPVIEDNPFPMHTINKGRTNYARLGLVADIFPSILREIMRSNTKCIAPEVLCQRSKNYLMTHQEGVNLNTNGTYDDIDFINLYKLMRSLLLLSDPMQGRGKQQTNADVTISDDVERLRIILQRIKVDIALIEMRDYFSNIVNITQRIDIYLGKQPDQGFAREVLNLQTHCMDLDEMEQKHHQTFKDSKDMEGSLLPQDRSSKLNRLLGHGSYESFEMRVMVTGQFGVGKTSLVMILVGDEAPHEAQSTDGIPLLEGRCGLDIETRDWILIEKNDYDACAVVYQRVLMTPDPKDKATGQYKPTKTEDATSKRYHTEHAIPKEIDTKLPTMVWPETTEAAKKDKKSESEEIVEMKPVQILKQEKMKSKMTRKEIKKQMEKDLKRGDYKMNVGRLLFWDFGGQYVYYTTHQTFMTYRALFLVVFDGSTDLYDEVPGVLCFPGQYGTPTPAVFLQHWVNSILTYCKVISWEIPQILFVATHKDKISEKDVEERRTSIYNGIDQLFKHHDGRNHLVLKHRVFVNSMNRNDPEIEILKKIITELTFNHPCWGERMPDVWIPLELEIAELTAEGRQIMSLKEIEELNNASEVSTLSSEDLKTFLQIQHSLGKIVYFNTPQLKDYVVISPLYLIEVMKSFVTDRQFWPKDSKAKEIVDKMSVHGVIQKSDLFSIWERKEFSKILLYKEYVFDMLVHLDILSEHRRYDQYTGSRLPGEDFFVPCMVTEQDTTSYLKNECTPQRAICLAFVFKGSILPPALPNRLISACLSMWHLKTYEGKKLLFSGFIGLTFDKSHEIIVCVESNKILLFILHKTSKGLIVRDIAIGIKECVYATLERILEFYQSASNQNSSQQQPFHVELACSNFKCFLPETEAKASENNHVICEGCNQNYEIEIWNQDKTTDNCHQNCTGLCEDALVQRPSDREIGRFSNQFNADMIHDLVIHLGLNVAEWENMTDNHPHNIDMVKFLILIKWREQNNGIFLDLAEALTAMNVTTHKLCQVRSNKRAKNRGLLAEHMDYIPTDEILDALAPDIRLISFNLGIELGLRAVDLERIQHDYERNLVKQTKQVLYEWRNDTTVRATLGVLEQALVNVGKGAMCLETVVETIGVEKRHNSRQQSI